MDLLLATAGDSLLETPPDMWCAACNCRCATVLRDNGHTRLIYNYWQHGKAPACFLIPSNIRQGVVVEFSRIFYSADHNCKCSKHWAGYVIGRTMTTLVIRRAGTARAAVDTPVVLGSVCTVTTPAVLVVYDNRCAGDHCTADGCPTGDDAAV